ncbi:MAG: MarR family transcriptional regulator [Gemmatimonadales bacterium]|nr:MAG: MarR family transcriptional regulator [Gemmatimonadales bacterium]
MATTEDGSFPGSEESFRSPAQAAVVGLFRMSDRARRTLAEALRPRDLTLQQFNVLRILRGAGDGGLPTLTIADRMVEQTPGVTRLLDRLQKQGWIERRRDPGDRRRVVACITLEGRQVLEAVDEPFARAEEDIFRDWAEEDVRALARLLHNGPP